MEDHTVVAYSRRKTKQLICGIEGENVVAYGRRAFPRSKGERRNKSKGEGGNMRKPQKNGKLKQFGF